MNSLLAALNTKFTSTSALTMLFTGNTLDSAAVGLHWDIAPSEAESPYVVAQVLSAPSQPAFGAAVTFSEVTIQYKVVGIGMAAMIGAMETFLATFATFTPTLSSGKCTGPFQVMDPMPMQLPAEETQGREEWQVVTQLTYGLEP